MHEELHPAATKAAVKERFNHQSLGEEIANGVSHGIGALLACIGSIFLIIRSIGQCSLPGVIGILLFCGSLILLYTISSLYHSLTPHKAKRVFQVLDHSSIFLLILGTYAPFCLIALPGIKGYGLLAVNVGITVLGITLNAVNMKRWHKFCVVGYLLMGWSVVFVIRDLSLVLGQTGMVLLTAGGIFYTLGILFYALKKPRYMHFIWHLFVLGGSICHFFCVYFAVLS